MASPNPSNDKSSQKAPAAKNESSITPRSVSYSDWYLDVIRQAELAEHSAVRGCMVICLYGYLIWEKM